MNASSHAKPNSVPPLRMKLATAPTTVSAPPMKIIAPGSALFSAGVGGLDGGKLIKSFQRGLLRGRQIVFRAEPAQLQCAQIRDDGPAILRRHQRAGGAHRALAVSDG